MPAVTVPPDPELAAIIRHGAELIPQVRDAIARATRADEPRGDFGKVLYELTSEFYELRKRLWRGPASPLADEVDALLNFQQQILEQAGLLAFRPRTEHWAKVAAHFGDGNLDSTRRLAELAGQC